MKRLLVPSLLLAGALLLGGIPIVAYFRHFAFDLSQEAASWGQFGDFVGGTLNPLFTFLSFGLLLYTFLLQREELRVSRQELEEAQNETLFRRRKEDHILLLDAISATIDATLDRPIYPTTCVDDHLMHEIQEPTGQAKAKFDLAIQQIVYELTALFETTKLLRELDAESRLPDYYEKTFSQLVARLRRVGLFR